MSLDFFRRINWVDIFVLIVLIRASYLALKNGFTCELFKFLGTVFSVYLALHYYTSLSDIFKQRIDLKVFPLKFLDFIFFVLLLIAGDFLFWVLRLAFARFIKMEAAPKLNKFGGLVLGTLRGFLLVSLIIFMLAISSISYFKNSAVASNFGRPLFKIAPATYSWLWNSVMSKFMIDERFNDTVLEIQESI